MVLLRHSTLWTTARRLKVLALDAFVTRIADRAILLVVVLFAIRVIVNDVEVCRSEWLLTGFAYETGLVPSSRQAAIRSLD